MAEYLNQGYLVECNAPQLKQYYLPYGEKRKDIFKLSLDDIILGTENFSDEKIIVREGNGMLYRGDVPYGNERKTVVMNVNRLREEHNFLKELEILFGLKHENILEVVGYCKEMDEKVVVYENVSKWGTLDSYVKDHRLTWTKRLEICIDVANGLKYLHGSFAKQQLIVHLSIETLKVLTSY
ncbi:receptor-like protein kinase FERONIA [Rutidosis leptorrhynchoides]|uniref:receptor-like protein kinase FERONIA n=1 Tax=Rutidosis leptorrhynchoides TaxID=125765 RepID=UPI003A9A41A0